MPWEEMAQSLSAVLEDEGQANVPHSPETLASIVLFSLRVGDVVDLNAWLPQAKLRRHVVLKLLCTLVDNKYPFPTAEVSPQKLRKIFEPGQAEEMEVDGSFVVDKSLGKEMGQVFD